jgi:hypothetical protein
MSTYERFCWAYILASGLVGTGVLILALKDAVAVLIERFTERRQPMATATSREEAQTRHIAKTLRQRMYAIRMTK